MKRTNLLLKRLPDLALIGSLGLLLAVTVYSAFRLNTYYNQPKREEQTLQINHAASVPDQERAKALEEAERTGGAVNYSYTTDVLPLPLGSM